MRSFTPNTAGTSNGRHRQELQKKIAVVMLTLNQCEKTIRCLSSFRSLKSPPFRILLWDNGSQDGTTDIVRKKFPEVLIHYHPSNLGAASGRNAAAELAIKALTPSHLLFIDNDMVVTPGFLDALLEPFKRDRRLAQTAAKIRLFEDKQRLWGAGGSRLQFWLGRTSQIGHGAIDRGQYDRGKKCIASTGCMLVRTQVFQEVGGFDPKFDPYGCEDLDFSLRICKAGYYGLYVPEALVFHDRSQTFGEGKYTEKYARVKARNWFLFMRRHASLMQQLGFVFLGAPYLFIRATVREGRKGNFRAARGWLRGKLDFWKASRL